MPNSTYSIVVASIASAGALSGLYLLYMSRKTSSSPVALGEVSELPIVGDKLPILSGKELLQNSNRQLLIQNIREKLGFSDTAFNNDVMPLLEQFAFYVQQTPASESHHHAHPGGLLDHCLEVAFISLRLSSGMNLPPNMDIEDRKRLGPVWKYGILVAALLHDLGKTITGMLIDLHSDANHSDGVRWQPEFGAMDMHGRYKYYRTAFRDEKMDYALHSQLAWSLFSIVVPMSSRTWINESDAKLFDGLREYLTGNKTEPFFSLIMNSDMESTSNNLRHGSRVRFSSAKQKPWIELFMESLRAMLAQRGGYFSIAKDAGGEVFRHGDNIYIVSKTLADTLRKYIHDNKLASLPSENHRIFDTFQEYGAIQTNPFYPNKSIWDVEVIMNTSTETGKTLVFTVLCFKISKLYGENKELWPVEYQGRLTPIDREQYDFPKKQELATKNTMVDDFESTKDVKPSEVAEQPATTLTTVESTNQNEDVESKPTIFLDAKPITEPVATSTNIDSTNEPVEKPGTLDLMSMLGAITNQVPSGNHAQHAQPLPVPEPQISAKKVSHGSDFANAQKRLAALKNLGTGNAKTRTAETMTIQDIHRGDELIVHKKSKQEPKEPSIDHNPNNAQISTTSTDLPLDERVSAMLGTTMQAVSSTMGDPVDMGEPSLESMVFESDMALPVDIEQIEQKHDEAIKVAQSEAAPRNEMVARRDLSVKFMNWLKDGLVSKTIEINTSSSMVHRVEEGLLLMSPKIFTEFSGDGVYRFSKDSPARQVQLAFESSKIIFRNKRTAQFKAQIETISGRKANFITVYLIPNENLHLLFSTPPKINPHLKLIKDEQLRIG